MASFRNFYAEGKVKALVSDFPRFILEDLHFFCKVVPVITKWNYIKLDKEEVR